MLTVVIGAAYGAYRLFGGGPGDPAPAGTAAAGDVPDVINHSIGAAFAAISTGLNMRNLADQYRVRDAIDVSIFTVGQDRARLVAAAPGQRGARADALTSAIDAEDRLGDAMTRWRDALFNLRFGQIEPAQSDMNDAITALAEARDAWDAAGSTS